MKFNLLSIFKLRESYTQEIIALLQSVRLGTNGTIYQHLDIEKRVTELENPLFLSMERSKRTLGNITFCRRNKDWYIRYFAFDAFLQSDGKQQNTKKDGVLVRELNRFFEDAISQGVRSFYAYIDPKNTKSLWMSERFNFEKQATIITQTYSRFFLPKSTKVQKGGRHQSNKRQPLFFEPNAKLNTYSICQNGKTIASARVKKVRWKITQLPGRNGKLKAKILPYIPLVNRIINPKEHSFVAIESLYCPSSNTQLIKELLDGILSKEKEHVIIWWQEESSKQYQSIQHQIKWGIMDKIIGRNKVDLVVKGEKTHFVAGNTHISGLDFV